MFSGEKTPQLGLPQYNPNDHPDFLTDINKAFMEIDTFASKSVKKVNELSRRVAVLEQELKQTRVDAGLTNLQESEENNELSEL